MEPAEKTTNRSDAVERLHAQLQDSLQELVTSEDWQAALAVAARFHDYSFSNTQLIWAQSLARGVTPSRVAGYRAWQELGRHVGRGEKGLQILAPVTRKITPENGEDEERRVVGFRVVHVFDLAQTEGEPLPEVSVALVEGDLPSHWDQVSGLIIGAGFDLQVADIERLGDANGITDWQQRDAVVRASLPGAQRFKTAIHELAHVRLHEPTSDGRPSCRGVASWCRVGNLDLSGPYRKVFDTMLPDAVPVADVNHHIASSRPNRSPDWQRQCRAANTRQWSMSSPTKGFDGANSSLYAVAGSMFCAVRSR